MAADFYHEAFYGIEDARTGVGYVVFASQQSALNEAHKFCERIKTPVNVYAVPKNSRRVDGGWVLQGTVTL